MPTIHPATPFNVEASLNDWLSTTLATYTLPSWLPTLPPVVYDWRAVALTLPCFSVVHIPVRAESRYQGGVVGALLTGSRVTAMLEVSCWVSRRDPNYPAQLRAMSALVHSAVAASRTVTVRDFAADPADPLDTSYCVVLGDITGGPVALDDNQNSLGSGLDIDNPDVLRARLLIDYAYTLRAHS